MPQKSKIEWCTHTTNPVIFIDRKTGKRTWRCVKVSAGCARCYSETMNKRFGNGRPFTAENMAEVECRLNEKELGNILRMKGKGIILFWGDMTDIFGDWVPGSYLDKMFAVMALTPHITHVLLTKRAERMAEYFSDDFRFSLWHNARSDILGHETNKQADAVDAAWPSGDDPNRLFNVLLGVSIEDQAAADARVPRLLKCPAAVRLVSCEPLLGPVDLHLCSNFSTAGHGPSWLLPIRSGAGGMTPTIHHIIVGGESGPGARPCNIEDIRNLVQQARAAKIPCFVKQLGSNPVYDENGDYLPGYPLKLKHPKGGNPDEWPEDLRVREPLVAAEVTQ